jgi:hypothetical protein
MAVARCSYAINAASLYDSDAECYSARILMMPANKALQRTALCARKIGAILKFGINL